MSAGNTSRALLCSIMKISHIRLLNIIYFIAMALASKWNYVWYLAAMHISLEVLNSRSRYLLHPYWLYNTVFWAYELVLLERLRKSHSSEAMEWLINCAEHVFFAIIICLKIYIYQSVFSKNERNNRLQKGLLAALLFNTLGLFNEVFQNYLAHRTLLVFIADSIKDVGMNALGSIIFLIAVLIRIKIKGNNKTGAVGKADESKQIF